MGTSRGTESVASFVTNNSRSVDGAVFTASITETTGDGWGMSDYDLEKITTPVLFVHHQDDGCSVTRAKAIPNIAKKLTGSSDVEVKFISGGKKGESKHVCGGKSHHGFFGSRGKATKAIVGFIKSH